MRILSFESCQTQENLEFGGLSSLVNVILENGRCFKELKCVYVTAYLRIAMGIL